MKVGSGKEVSLSENVHDEERGEGLGALRYGDFCYGPDP